MCLFGKHSDSGRPWPAKLILSEYSGVLLSGASRFESAFPFESPEIEMEKFKLKIGTYTDITS